MSNKVLLLLAGCALSWGCETEPFSRAPLQSGSVGNAQIKNNAIGGGKIAPNSVDGDHIVDGSLTGEDIEGESIGADQLADGAIGNRHIQGEAIAGFQIQDGAVGEDQIATDAVGPSEIQDDAIKSQHITNGAVSQVHLSDDSVGSAQIENGAISTSHIANDAVRSQHIADGAVFGIHVATGSIGSAQISNGSISTADIADDAIGSQHIANSSIQQAHIAFDAVNSDQLAPDSVNSSHLQTHSVGFDELMWDSVSSLHLEDDSVDSDALQDYIELQWLEFVTGAPYSSAEIYAFSSTYPATITTYWPTTGNEAATIDRNTDNKPLMGVSAGVYCCDAGMYIDSSNRGYVFGDVKSFVTEHPEDPDLRIVYAAIEGPEAAAYVRGTALLHDGQAIIELPDHFGLIASPRGMTATLTPMSAESLGLAVTEISPERIVVEELHNGRGSYRFSYRIESERIGFEDFEVIRDASEFTVAPHPEKARK